MQLRTSTLVVMFILLYGTVPLCSTQYQRCCQDEDAHRLPCDSEKMNVTCRLNEMDLHGFKAVKVEILAGQRVQIQLDDSTACFWKQRGPVDKVMFQTFDVDGVYTAECETNSINISVHIQSKAKRPSIPNLTVTTGEDYSVNFICVSEGIPKPEIRWYHNRQLMSEGKVDVESTENKSRSIMNFAKDNSNIGCCAKNPHGEDCSQIYSYDLDVTANENEASQILLRPGQSLVLQCRVKRGSSNLRVTWNLNHTKLATLSLMTYEGTMTYYSINSVHAKDSGDFKCYSKNGQQKTVKLQVLEKDWLQILRMDENLTMSADKILDFCFQIQVLSLPKSECYGITPNATKVRCRETGYRWGKSTFQLCNLEPGQYQVHVRAGAKVLTRNMSLCLKDVPKFVLHQEQAHITCRTNSTMPLTMFWKTRPSNAALTDLNEWMETSVGPQDYPDSEQFCHKQIDISRPSTEVDGHFVKCCIRKQEEVYCSDQISVQIALGPSVALVVTCSVLVLALLLLLINLCVISLKKKPGYETQLQMIQMVGPSDNDYVYIDFKDFKYDQRWEFPRENLELGNELGSGAFGMVVEATAYGISKPGVSLQVAVKMLKEKHQAVEKEALMSELKMLTHVGHHDNIVNLLGACTGTGPIYLIFQFCQYGDLLNYLKNNREHFYKSLTDAFDKDRFSSLYQNHQRKRNSSEFVQPDDHYVRMYPVQKEQEALLSATITDNTEEMFDDEDEEDPLTLTYDDLLSFSYQVAKGMEFLSFKNCIHRDLAARNILVTRGRLVKIGDFGLARDIEHDSNYVVRGNARLPVKWMAPESIFRGMYTMQSDVWAYGILLWEIFSLGVTPYPGFKVDNTFYTMIERGFQMERPFYALESVYDVMRRCWALEPKDRPCFSKLVAFMEYQLSNVEKQLYYNDGFQQKRESVYQNTPLTKEQSETDTAKQETDQTSVTDTSCNTDT